MTVSKVYYYERASIFDRMLILLLGLACMYLVNMKSNCPPCVEYGKVLENIKQNELRGGLSSPSSSSKSHESEQRKTSSSSGSLSSSKSGSSSWSKSGGSSSSKKSASSSSSSKSSGSGQKSSSSSSKSSSKSSSSGGSEKKSSYDKNKSKAWEEKNWQESNKKPKKKDDDGQIPADSLWQNKHDVVHIMTTRYMQLQPDLIHLGKARNALFRTFTLPSVVAQSTQEFVWIIFTDPDLNPELLDELVEMIKPYNNILLLGMNNGMNNFRTTGWMSNIKQVFSGDLQMLKDYRVASKYRVLLETRIDADDSIFVDMMDNVQRQAAKTMGKRAKEHDYDPDKIKEEYRVWCTNHSLEWSYFNAWDKTSKKGHIFGISHEEFCISAGLTYGYQAGTDKDDLPTTSHHKMSVEIPTCAKSKNNRNCLERIDAGDYKYVMLRSRTPTSAGMLGVIPTKEVINSETWKNQQDWAWENVIEKNFAVTPESIFELRRNLKKNMVHILTDALKGQCTKAEFTCKDSTKKDLNTLLEAVSANE